MRPESTWALSRWLHARGWRYAAWLVKTANYFFFRCVLPPEVEVVGGEVAFLHRGLGVVIDPDVKIVGSVTISHGVTIGTAGGEADHPRVTLLEGAFIGAGATVIAPFGKSIIIGRNTAIGASSHVYQNVPENHRVGAPGAQMVRVVAPLLATVQS